jgi:hypothetical protein
LKKIREDRSRVRSENLMVKLSPEEKSRFEKAADDSGMTMSALARMLIASYLNNN